MIELLHDASLAVQWCCRKTITPNADTQRTNKSRAGKRSDLYAGIVRASSNSLLVAAEEKLTKREGE
jgi:hypothetical protein